MGEQRHGEKIFFPVQLTTSSTVGNHTRLMPSLSVENEQADAGQTGRLNPSRETKFSGAYGDRVIFIFLLQLTTSTIDCQPYPVDPYSLCYYYSEDYTIHTYIRLYVQHT